MKNHTVKVTREHISTGTPEEGDSCMVALAIQEIPGVDKQSVFVDGDTAKYEIDGHTFDVELPKFVREHIRTFDCDCYVCIEEDEEGYEIDHERDTSIIPEFEFELPVARDP